MIKAVVIHDWTQLTDHTGRLGSSTAAYSALRGPEEGLQPTYRAGPVIIR